VSEDVIRKLAGFSPAPPAVDRDELLFRAGRASAPSPRWWKRAVAGLLVLQAVTVGLLVRKPTPQPAATSPSGQTAPEYQPEPGEPPAPNSYLVLSHDPDFDRRPVVSGDGVEPRRSPTDPLTAGSRRLVLD
jgi:hypothetical protein